MPPTINEMRELVAAHNELPDPLDAAIWIRQHDHEAWLVEVLPTLPRDEHAERPVAFNPGRQFRHPLNLVAGCMEDLEAAVRRDVELARAIADGEPLHGPEVAAQLIALARELAGGHQAAG